MNCSCSCSSELSRLEAENARLNKEIRIRDLAVPMEEELSDRIDETLKYLAMGQGFTLNGVARLLSEVQKRMAADWHTIGSERRERKAAESKLSALIASVREKVTEWEDAAAAQDVKRRHWLEVGRSGAVAATHHARMQVYKQCADALQQAIGDTQ